ncbi:MAG: PD-(D/E)XK nuclease family protein, partial [Spirochaetes bacterium]|nr:PD-(D/E)XK nuclease family protein [Spirochaetota bacterium]
GLLRGIIFHAVIERIRKLPLGSGELDRLLDMASAREGRRYTKTEVTAAVKEVRPVILNVIADHRLTKYFSDNAVSELGIFSDRYQNLTGRIDRIYLGEEIEVIDFKTNLISGDAELGRLVEAYGEQVDAYCATVREIFPGMSVRGYLYFTGAADSKRLVQVGRKT